MTEVCQDSALAMEETAASSVLARVEGACSSCRQLEHLHPGVVPQFRARCKCAPTVTGCVWKFSKEHPCTPNCLREIYHTRKQGKNLPPSLSLSPTRWLDPARTVISLGGVPFFARSGQLCPRSGTTRTGGLCGVRRARATTATVVPGVTYIHTYIQPYINTYIHACIYAREPVQVHLEHRAHRFSPYRCLDFRCPSPCPRDARPRTGKDQSTTLCSGWAAVTATRAVRARLGRAPRHNKTLDCRPSHILLENNEMRVSSASSGRPASPARSSLDPNKAACSRARARGRRARVSHSRACARAHSENTFYT